MWSHHAEMYQKSQFTLQVEKEEFAFEVFVTLISGSGPYMTTTFGSLTTLIVQEMLTKKFDHLYQAENLTEKCGLIVNSASATYLCIGLMFATAKKNWKRYATQK